MPDNAKPSFEFTPINQSTDAGSKPSFQFTPVNQEQKALLPDPKPTNIYSVFGGSLDTLHERVNPQQADVLKQLDVLGPEVNDARAKIALRYDIENSGLYKIGALQQGYEDTNWEQLRDDYYSNYTKLNTKGKSDADVYAMRQEQLMNDARAAQYGSFRPPTALEKVSLAWDKYTGGFFNPGVKAAPIHAEGVTSDWTDWPHRITNWALEQALTPANIATGIVGGAATGVSKSATVASTALEYGGKVYGGLALSQLPAGLQKTILDVEDPTATKAQVIEDLVTTGFQAYIAKSTLTSGDLSLKSKYSVYNAISGLPKDMAGDLARDLYKTTPIEASKVLYEYGNKTTGLSADKLYEASENMRKMSEVEPEDAKVLNRMQRAWGEVQSIIAPESRTPEARQMANILRQRTGNIARSVAVATDSLKEASDVFDNIADDQRFEFINNIETGQPQPELINNLDNKIDAQKVQMFDDTIRTVYEQDKKDLESLKPDERRDWIENYFVHQWKDPEAAREKIQKQYTGDKLLGNKNFLLKRTIPTIKDGMIPESQGGPGLVPVSSNPVELTLNYHRQVRNYIEGQKAIAEAKDKNLIKAVMGGGEIPEGYVRVEGPLGNIYGPKYGAVGLPDEASGVVEPDDVRVYGKRIMGNYYATPDVALILNNFSSQGLEKYKGYRAYMSLSNAQNQLQLGLSALHGTTTSINSVISRMALVTQNAFEAGRTGDVEYVKDAFKNLVQVPVAPITDLFKSNAYRKAYVLPGSLGEELAKELDAYASGGGSAFRDERFKTNITRQMKDYFAQNTIPSNLKGALAVPFALSEGLTGVIMDQYVPRIKLSVAVDNLKLELNKLGQDATIEQVRESARKVIDSVDNRFGQMSYDNLFWNKTLKDVSFGSIRAVGWDLGTIREAGGAGIDTALFLRDALKPDKKAEFTQRMAYMISFPIVTMTMGAIYQYLKTGEKPQELKDYFFPKNGATDQYGNPMRSSLFAYTKDYYNYYTDPVGTVTSKVNPTITTFYDMIRNKDFYGKEIVNADDPLVKELSDFANYLYKTNKPIGLRQFETSGVVPKTTEQYAEQLAGIGAPPKAVGKTQAELLAAKTLSKRPFGDKPYDAQQQAELNLIEKYLRTGTVQEQNLAQDKLDDMLDKGIITKREKEIIERGTEMTYLQKAVERMTVDEALKVYSKATIKEQDEIRDFLERKINRLKVDGDKRDEYMDKLDNLSKVRNVDTSLR